jgi:hypothetical protein
MNTPMTAERAALYALLDRAEWLARFSDNGSHPKIAGPTAGEAWECAQDIRAAVSTLRAPAGEPVAEGLCAPVAGARFGHHPSPAIDFEIEVESLVSRLFNAQHKLAKLGEPAETVGEVAAAIARAMTFNVGGDPISVAAKARLRALEKNLTTPPVVSSPPSEAPGEGKAAVIRAMNYALWMNGNGGCEPNEDYKAGWHAAMAADPSPAEQGAREELDTAAVEVGHVTFESMRQCADSWLAVVSLLHELAPDWCMTTETGREAAITTIRKLSSPPLAAGRVGVAVDDAMVERACVEGHGANWTELHELTRDELREEMREVLTAALAGPLVAGEVVAVAWEIFVGKDAPAMVLVQCPQFVRSKERALDLCQRVGMGTYCRPLVYADTAKGV